jgi:hypothetical protein
MFALWLCLRVYDRSTLANQFFAGVTIGLSIGLLQSVLVLASSALVVLKRPPKQLILLGFLVLFLIGISLSPLHWERWIIQVLPLLALFAAHGLESVLAWFTKLKVFGTTLGLLTVFATLMISIHPLYNVVLLDIRNSNVSTHILAYEWLQANLPAGTKVVAEKYTIPLTSQDLDVFEQPWSGPDRSVAEYYRDGYHYVVINLTSGYENFIADPDLYPSQLKYYQTLFETGQLTSEFRAFSDTARADHSSF